MAEDYSRDRKCGMSEDRSLGSKSASPRLVLVAAPDVFHDRRRRRHCHPPPPPLPTPHHLLHLFYTMSVASRRLALNLQQSLRSRAAINSVKARQSPLLRGLATPVSHGAKTESTTLGNGFTVSTLFVRKSRRAHLLTMYCLDRLPRSTLHTPRHRPSESG